MKAESACENVSVKVKLLCLYKKQSLGSNQSYAFRVNVFDSGWQYFLSKSQFKKDPKGLAAEKVVSEQYACYPYLILKQNQVKSLESLQNGNTYLIDNVKLMLNNSLMPVLISKSNTVIIEYKKQEG